MLIDSVGQELGQDTVRMACIHLIHDIWGLSCENSKAGGLNNWGLKSSKGSCTYMSGVWAGKTEDQNSQAEHLHLASPWLSLRYGGLRVSEVVEPPSGSGLQI